MNRETYEKLKKYYIHLRRGYKGNYVFGLLQKDFDELYKIYKELGGNAQLRYTCQSCCLQLLKFLGKLYFEYEENLMKEPDVSPVVSDDENVTVKQPDEVKKRKTRKKKEED